MQADRSAPRRAATVVLLREAAGPPELLLTVRPRTLRFMGGATVFPGGAVGTGDLDPRWERASRLSRARAAALLSANDGAAALGAFVCALREAFEEVGLLLGTGPVERLERATASDGTRWLEHCLDLGVVLETDRLLPAGRWVTPEPSPVRFDARFFLARVPPEWEPVPDPAEVERCWWTTPAAALQRLAMGELTMAPPTIRMLQSLAEHDDLDAIFAAFSHRSAGEGGRPLSATLEPLVRVVLAPNPGPMTGPGTNTYVVGAGSTAVIDPAVDDPGYVEALLVAAGAISSILVTHRHPDHIGGVPAIVKRTGAPVRAFGEAPVAGLPPEPLSDGETVAVEGMTLTALHTPGHSSDHLCFTSDGALFAGDNVAGEGTTVIAPPDGDMRAYLDSLDRMRKVGARRIYPGHFRPLDDPNAVLGGYIAHRAGRHAAILAAVAAGSETLAEIVRAVYTDTPVVLHPVALDTVLAHLQMAEADGQVRRSGDRWQPPG